MAELYILYGRDGAVCGVYDSVTAMKAGVDYWMKAEPEYSLSHELWEMNDPNGAVEWEWCYIPLSANLAKLKEGGGNVPNKSYWGKNIVDTKWESNEHDITD